MFERFTDLARRVVVDAQDEARMLNHNYIGTEHLLLGLLREEQGLASQVLEELGIHLEAARTEVEATVGRGDGPPTSHIPFTPRAKKVMELALRDAISIGHNYIGTEHILLGLIREGEGVAVQVLRELGADPGRARAEVLEKLGNPPEKGRRKVGRRRLPVESRPVDIPCCPTCGRDLASHAAHTRLTIGDGAESVEVPVVYCRGCGRTLGTSVI